MEFIPTPNIFITKIDKVDKLFNKSDYISHCETTLISGSLYYSKKDSSADHIKEVKSKLKNSVIHPDQMKHIAILSTADCA